MQFALGTVTLLALLMTVAMGIVAWRLVREERRRAAARLSALTAELKAQGTTPSPIDPPETHPTPPADLFDRPLDSSSGWQRRLAGVGVAGALLAVLVFVAVRAVSPGDAASLDVGSKGPHEGERPPVELLTLAHERRDGMLSISGTVRNFEEGMEGMDEPLSVLAVAFDDDGTMVASGRTHVLADTLPAGADSSFTISLPAQQVSRYRISFLADETTVPHIDRRGTTTAQETES